MFNFTKPRRRSNSSGGLHGVNDFKTKFEVNEPEPVFEESIHGTPVADEAEAEVEGDLAKTDSSSSGTASFDEDKSTKSL